MKLLRVKTKIAPSGYDEQSTSIVLDEENAKKVATWLKREVVDLVYDAAEAGWDRKELKVTLEE
ncbi:hypothetical protein DRO59_03405 [Candidatus Bathyarchaeota archaeon]|nr:MAG: hypothetical protein DRO59_03405 [Candidatus Bathyarchaeota archaeon]